MGFRQDVFHENLLLDHPERADSDRRFGLIFSAFLSIFGIVRGFHFNWSAKAYLPFLGTALIFALFALVIPQVLGPLNWLWQKLGIVVSRVTQPIILALLYFGLFVPMGVIVRALRTTDDFAINRNLVTYWVPRSPGPVPSSLPQQY